MYFCSILACTSLGSFCMFARTLIYLDLCCSKFWVSVASVVGYYLGPVMILTLAATGVLCVMLQSNSAPSC